MHSFQQLPLEFVSLLFKTLPLHEVRELRRTDKWFNHCILNLVPRIRTTHIIWTGNASTPQYKRHRFWIQWSQSFIRLIFHIPCVVICGLYIPVLMLHVFLNICADDSAQYQRTLGFSLLWFFGCGRRLVKLPQEKGTTPKGIMLKMGEDDKQTIVAAPKEGPFHSSNIKLNIMWLICGGWCFSVLLILGAALQAITIVGIPNVPVYLFYAKALLWPAGYQYYHIKIPVPPVDPRYTSLRSFLSINNENVVFSDGEPIPPEEKRWTSWRSVFKTHKDNLLEQEIYLDGFQTVE